ncbi:unnamed protein product, partial [Schistosoma margrebowiei]
DRLQWIVSKHPSGAKPFVKLLLPEILPSSVNKVCHRLLYDTILQYRGIRTVIVLDLDMILNTNIVELWNHFEKFEETQMIGIGLEQNPYFQEVMKNLISDWEECLSRFDNRCLYVCIRSSLFIDDTTQKVMFVFSFQGYGYNGGILLFDLSKLRLMMWNDIWLSITVHLLQTKGYLITGEQKVINLTIIFTLRFHLSAFQDVMNMIVFKYKDLLYEIPCEWNIQLSAGSEPERCPVSWLSHAELKKRNYYTINKQPKIIHINHHIKPEDKYFPKPVSINKIDRSDVILKRK